MNSIQIENIFRSKDLFFSGSTSFLIIHFSRVRTSRALYFYYVILIKLLTKQERTEQGFNRRVCKKLIQAQYAYLDYFALLYAELELIRCLNSSCRLEAISYLHYQLHNQPSIIIIIILLYFSLQRNYFK